MLGAAVLSMLLWPGAWFAGKSVYSTDNLLAQEPWRSELARSAEFHNPELGDQDLLFFPQLAFIVRQLHEEGRLPLWNPGIYAGVPLDGNPQMPLLSPWTLGLELFQPRGESFSLARLALGLTWIGILRFVLCAAFAYLWLRRIGGRPWLAALGAAQLSAGPYASLWWFSTPGQVLSAMPMALYFLEGLLRGGGRRQLAAFALSLGLSHQGGYPQTSLLFLAFLPVYAWLRADEGQRLERCLQCLIGAGISVLLALPSWLPFLTYLGHSWVSELRASQDVLLEFHEDPWSFVLAGAGTLGLLALAWRLATKRAEQSPSRPALVAFLLAAAFSCGQLGGGDGQAALLLLPDLAGHPVRHPPFGLGAYIEVNQDHVGLVTALLLLARPRWGPARYLLLFVLLAVSRMPVLNQALRGSLPLLEPSRLSCLVPLLVAQVFVSSVERLLNSDVETRVRCLRHAAIACLCFLLPLLLLCYLAHARFVLTVFDAVSLAVAGLVAVAPLGARGFPGFLACFAVLAALHPGFRFQPERDPAASYPETETIRFLEREAATDPDLRIFATDPGVLGGNAPLAYGLRLSLGWDGMDPKNYVTLLSYLADGRPRQTWRSSRLGLERPFFDLLASSLIVAAAKQKLPEHFTILRRERAPFVIARNQRAAARVFLVDKAYRWDKTPARITERPPEESVAFLEEDWVELPEEPMTRGRARILQRGSDELVIETESDGAAYLVVMDNLLPGWRAEIDGEAARIHRAYMSFRCVVVPKGRHRVLLAYRPRDFWLGVVLAGLALLALLAVMIPARLPRASPWRPGARS
ncbi:MAG: hypothetical protein ACE5F1_15295 [Planctomycetota bacterium]